MIKTLLIMTTLATLIAMTAQADDHQRNQNCNRDRHHNYILSRQELGLVQGEMPCTLLGQSRHSV